MTRPDGPLDGGRGLRRPGQAGRVLLTVAIVAVVTLAGLGTYDFIQSEFGGTTLVVYTYPSLLGGANCGGSPAFTTAFQPFASAHGIRIDVVCPPGTAYSWLVDQSGAPAADLVIGLDEITTPEAEAAHLLTPYAPPALANVSPALVAELSPDDAAVPYEYGYLAVDYNETFYAATGGRVASLNFTDLVDNTTWARSLLVEDPESDITVDTSDFQAGGTVTVTVTCDFANSGLSLPIDNQVTETSVAPIDPYRDVGP